MAFQNRHSDLYFLVSIGVYSWIHGKKAFVLFRDRVTQHMISELQAQLLGLYLALTPSVLVLKCISLIGLSIQQVLVEANYVLSSS